MKSRIEPMIANLPANSPQEIAARGEAMGALLGRDSEAIKNALETLRTSGDARLSALASYMLYAGDSPNPSDRVANMEL
jgi:hypothetical protein